MANALRFSIAGEKTAERAAHRPETSSTATSNHNLLSFFPRNPLSPPCISPNPGFRDLPAKSKFLTVSRKLMTFKLKLAYQINGNVGFGRRARWTVDIGASYYVSMRVFLLNLCLVGSLIADSGLSTFEHHPAIEISLFAQEPMVVDPVALAFSAPGEAYVVEMRDYPHGVGPDNRPGGSIRLLRDTNMDGVADETHVFAQDLSFPTSVAIWRKGILVAAPPQILYLEDSDGDDVADVRRVILDGFKLAVTDSNLNSLRWGMDGRMHSANGGAGGKVFSPLTPDVPPQKLGDYDFAFDPDNGTFERTAHTGGGFGLVFDRAGHSFTTYNINYLQERIISKRYLDLNPALPRFEATVNISAHGESARIYPIATAQTRVNHPEQAGYFSSAGGMGLVETGPFAEALGTSIFVCDVVGNLVHRDLLEERGPIFHAQRAPEEKTKEFIASADPNFRPIALEYGPDGALYLIDMQRDVIEHPDYIPAKVLAKMDVRAGDDRGRIYRILPKKGLPDPGKPLSQAAETELAAALRDTNPWRATTAHRLLFERDKISAVTPSAVSRGLEAASPGEREGALVQSESLSLRDELLTKILSLAADDPHPRVRFQAALSLGHRSHPGKVDALKKLLLKDHEHLWSRRAVWAALKGEAWLLLKHIVKTPLLEHEELMAELTELVTNESGQDPAYYEWLEGLPLQHPRGMLNGLRASCENKSPPESSRQCLDSWTGRLIGEEQALLGLYRIAKLPLPPILQESWRSAASSARDSARDLPERLAAIALIAEVPEANEVLLELLNATQVSEVQEAALRGLRLHDSDNFAQEVILRWRGLSPSFRPQLIQWILRRTSGRVALLDALEAKQITVQELNLDLEQRRTLLRWSSGAITKRAKSYFGDEEYSNRKVLVEEWLDKLPASGDITIGKKLFETHCALCHQVGSLGKNVGPNLTGVSHRSVEDLLSHILDPNMAINPNYVTCVVETNDGTVFTGLLAEDDAKGISLKLAQGLEQRVPRQSIKRKEVVATSLMPEGMEAAITPQQMRDLIAFLQES